MVIVEYCKTPPGTGALPGLRVLLHKRPSTPASMNRRCQHHAQGLYTPARRITSAVSHRSAVARMISCPQYMLLSVAIAQHGFEPLPIPGSSWDLNILLHHQTMAHNPFHSYLCIVQTDRPSPLFRRVGIGDFTFEACSDYRGRYRVVCPALKWPPSIWLRCRRARCGQGQGALIARGPTALLDLRCARLPTG
jgi:hypothetical protein